jgi:hypothetical protein
MEDKKAILTPIRVTQTCMRGLSGNKSITECPVLRLGDTFVPIVVPTYPVQGTKLRGN